MDPSAIPSTCPETPKRAAPEGKSRRVCWQGWQLDLPRRWDPVTLQGDYSAGQALFADALRPRLGIRWRTCPRRKFDAANQVQAALKEEIGLLAAAEAKPFAMSGGDWQASTLYIEPEPAGRDVWMGHSQISGRLLQVVYHAHRRENVLAGRVLPGLLDLPAETLMPWAIFDLRCTVPRGMNLIDKRLNAGDLCLTFADRSGQVSVRQIAIAELALRRMPLEGWIADQQRGEKRYHRPLGTPVPVNITNAGREIPGRMARMTRRRRYFWASRRPAAFVTFALHDAQRDRIVIVHGSDETLVRQIAATVGN